MRAPKLLPFTQNRGPTCLAHVSRIELPPKDIRVHTCLQLYTVPMSATSRSIAEGREALRLATDPVGPDYLPKVFGGRGCSDNGVILYRTFLVRACPNA